ncbi:hypothetical protein [Catellatospora chokoriensis]|uniref:Uncharacterized protein n=1 Tax=Catellatospora chokoriensis TaxID=310353 RepID=A0A8J3JXR4_9ACTN|nr:hypothetical protein [Catellatospora chokoriensis]GIF90419.1 hypothetical protein Cch02nite_38630 [Catellatospora chokoriensis]
MPTTADQAEFRYEHRTQPSYTEHVATTFEAETSDESVVLHGSCPRCGHVMEYLIDDDVVRSSRTITTDTPGAEPSTAGAISEHMACMCDMEHSGRPEGYRGCGAHWYLQVTR